MTNILYHAPLACSLAARFAAAEGEVELGLEYVNLQSKELERGGSLFDVNPLGQVSVLRLASGEILTETATVLLWTQLQSEKSEFRRDPGHPDYFQMMRWIAFCATELHKQIFRIVFYSEATDAVKDRIRALAPARFDLLDKHLSGRSFLVGDSFSAADAYLTWFFVLAEKAGLDFSAYPNLDMYCDQMLGRPLIRALVTSDTAKRTIVK